MLVILSATVDSFQLPGVAPCWVIFGIDQLMDMGRTATNVPRQLPGDCGHRALGRPSSAKRVPRLPPWMRWPTGAGRQVGLAFRSSAELIASLIETCLSGKLHLIPLGGLGEFGMNCMAVRWGDEIIVIDAGLMFPESELLGVDIVVPGYLLAGCETARRSAAIVAYPWS